MSSVAPSKGHLLFINRVFPPDSGASGLRLMELAQGLAEEGWAITVLTNKGRNTAPANLHKNIRLVRIGMGSVDKATEAVPKKPAFWHYPIYLGALTGRALALPRADAVITLTDPPMASIVSAFVKIFRGSRAIHWVHDLYPNLFPVMGVRLGPFQAMLNGLARWALRQQDAVVALGDDMRDILLKDGVKAEKISVIPNWPDVKAALIDKKKPERHDSKNPFVLEGSFTVLYSGNFGLVHDFDAIIEAMKIVQQSPKNIRFILAGDGIKFAEVRKQVEEMLLTNVHFLRAQPKNKFIDLLLAGDLHIATMIPEATGLVAPSKINSALGLGRPCLFIGSPKSFQAKLIADYDAGKVIDMTDPNAKFALAEAILDYANDHDRFEAAQQNALRAAESISFDKALASFDALCARVITSR